MVGEWSAIGKDITNGLSLAREVDEIMVRKRNAKGPDESRNYFLKWEECDQRVSGLGFLGSLFYTCARSYHTTFRKAEAPFSF